MRYKKHLRFKMRKKDSHSSNEKMFTDKEAKILEREFIKAYSGKPSSTVKILLRLYRRYPLQLFLSVLFYIIATLPHILTPIITANLINVTVSYIKGDCTDYLTPLFSNIAFLVALLIINIPSNVLYSRFKSAVMRKVEVGLRGALVRKLQQLSIPFHKEMQSGRIQSKLMRDVETVQSLSTQLFSSLPHIVINLVTALIVVITKNPIIFAFFVLCIPAATLTMRAFRTKIISNNREFRKGMEETSASVSDMVEMTQITRAHGLEDKEINKMTSLLNKVASTGFRLDMIQSLFGACSWVIFQLFQLLCLVFSVFMAINGQIEIGDISMYQSYFSTLTGQVSTIVGLLPIITKGFESISSIGEILGANDIEDNKGKKRLDTLSGEYEFENVVFSYEDDQPLLKGLNLKVKAGETIAIVGESGSGKSTILNLILGFNTAKHGRVLVDGHDISQINLHTYRQHLAIVPQNSVMFSGTIRENITYGLKSVSDEQLNKILEASRLTDLINSLPQGLDSKLSEHASNLSGGQRQRISIARALIRDPQVIIFDEATSALDTVSEKEIQKAINNLSKGRTTFIVAHRLSTIKDADRIAVIKDGICCEIGSFDELMEKKGEFYKMQTLQTI